MPEQRERMVKFSIPTFLHKFILNIFHIQSRISVQILMQYYPYDLALVFLIGDRFFNYPTYMRLNMILSKFII